MTTNNLNDSDIIGLSMETSSDSEKESSKRHQERILARDIATILLRQGRNIEIQIQDLSGSKLSSGIILDLSSGGVNFFTADEYHNSEILRISFNVGKHLFLCQTRVAWSKKEAQGYIVGVQFTTINEGDLNFIKSLYIAMNWH